MSAFLVSPKHIGAIVSYATNKSLWSDFPTNPEDRAELLARANLKSVHTRYPQDKPDPIKDETYVEACASASLEVFPRKRKPVEIIKLCDCLNYQSCEFNGWYTSDAYKLLNAIREKAIRGLPGYSEAAWELA